MWNIFKFKRNKRNSSVLRDLKDVATIVKSFDLFEQHGIITWRRKDNILIIEEWFAIMKMAEGQRGFLNFLSQAALWQNERIFREAYETLRVKMECEAVRKAKQQHAVLSLADVQRIRLKVREDMRIIPPENLDCIQEFDIFVVRSSAPSVLDASVENGQLLALGHFNGKTVDMAMYDDIKHLLYDTSES